MATVVRNNLALYNDRAADWWSGQDRFFRHLANLVPARFEFFDRVAPAWEGLEVLDLGCGGGFMAEALARRGARVVGVDPSPGAIDAARSHAAELGLSIDYRAGGAEALPLEDASVDRVVCVDVLEHLTDLPCALAEVRRVLRPGGLFLYDTINDTRLARLVTITLGEDLLRLLPRGTHDPALFIRPERLCSLMTAAGLLPGEIVGLGPVGLTLRLDLRFGLHPTTQVMYIGIAQG